ncbi:MAG: hypothetical protein J6K26_08585, partial [Lachnospiraceae bacterium]|nr:hypothetical protein [Lachnospiraceae bacterium]
SRVICGFIDKEGNIIGAYDQNSMQLDEFFKSETFHCYMGQDGYCTEDGKAVIGAAEVIDEEIHAKYRIVDIRGTDNITLVGGGLVVAGTFGKSGLIPCVDYQEVNAVMKNGGTKEEVMNAPVSFYYMDKQGYVATSVMTMSCEEFDDFTWYFQDMYYGKSAEIQSDEEF